MRELVWVVVLGLGLILYSTIWIPCMCTRYLPCNRPYTCIAISQNTVMCKFSATVYVIIFAGLNFCGLQIFAIFTFLFSWITDYSQFYA